MDSETQKTEPLYEFLAWLEVNKKRVAIGAVAVLVAAGIIATVVWYNKQQEFTASEALSNIRLPFNPAEAVPAETTTKLQKLIGDYPNTAAGMRGELILAGLLFTDGKYPEAQAAFEKFLRAHPESQWSPQAAYSVAVCLDASKKTNDALLKYEDYARRYPTDPNADQARLHLGTLYEAAGKPAQAIEQYDKITKAMTFSPAAQEAQERQRALLVKFPQLAPAPATTPSPVSLTQTTAVTTVRTNLVRPTNNVPLMLRGTGAPPVRIVPTPAPAGKAK